MTRPTRKQEKQRKYYTKTSVSLVLYYQALQAVVYYTLLIGIYFCVNLPQTERNLSVYSGAKVSHTNRCRSVQTVRHQCQRVSDFGSRHRRRTVWTLRHYNLVLKCPGADVSPRATIAQACKALQDLQAIGSLPMRQRIRINIYAKIEFCLFL